MGRKYCIREPAVKDREKKQSDLYPYHKTPQWISIRTAEERRTGLKTRRLYKQYLALWDNFLP